MNQIKIIAIEDRNYAKNEKTFRIKKYITKP